MSTQMERGGGGTWVRVGAEDAVDEDHVAVRGDQQPAHLAGVEHDRPRALAAHGVLGAQVRVHQPNLQHRRRVTTATAASAGSAAATTAAAATAPAPAAAGAARLFCRRRRRRRGRSICEERGRRRRSRRSRRRHRRHRRRRRASSRLGRLAALVVARPIGGMRFLCEGVAQLLDGHAEEVGVLLVVQER